MDFYARMGQALNLGPGCGCATPNLGAAATNSFQTVDASQALSITLRVYVELSLQAEKLRQLLAAKVKIPCAIWSAYEAARADYMTKATELFNQLAQKGVTVEQVLWSGGKPVMDPNDPNKVKTLQIQAPLRPPAFAIQSLCPTVPVMYGADEMAPVAELGFVPAAIAAPLIAACTAATAGACLALVIGGSTIAGIIGYTAYKSMQQIAVMFREYESAPSKTVAAYTDCVTKLVGAGYSQENASSKCSATQTSAQNYAAERGKEGTGWSFWTWVAILGGAAIAGAVLLGAAKRKLSAPVRAALPAMGEAPRTKHLLLGEVYLKPKY